MCNYKETYKQIEKKWQDIWKQSETFKAKDELTGPKFYALVEFPYPSAHGLHVGHPRSYTALDIISRKRRFTGYNVLYPMGWDAFGLPTENFAIKNHIHPRIVTNDNIVNFKRQLESIGFSFDWSKEINTTSKDYYKWTQWIFLKLFEKGLAYKTEMPINWCTSCKCGLANEEVVGGLCERCNSEVVLKAKSQWMLKITAYADRLIDDLDQIDYIDQVKASQKNWIGRSYGAEVIFKVKDSNQVITVYTTRPDTLYGATYMVVAPEHPVINTLDIKNKEEVEQYRAQASAKTEFVRSQLSKEKTGVRLEGVWGINPVNNTEIPIFIADYVLMGYGTGAIMAVPAHDVRDHEFAKEFSLPIIEVVKGGEDVQQQAYTDTQSGVLVNSGIIDGLSVAEGSKKIVEELEKQGLAIPKTNFKLRDWVFSRQRYWGEPIPLVNCPSCGYVALDESSLPLELPDIDDFTPRDDGQSPLASCHEWLNTKCPKCHGAAQRETDTMPQWAGSSWYFLRYCDPQNSAAIADSAKLDYWMPVDWYNGGMEHTTLHLLYSRFWHKFLYDIGVVKTKEPYAKRTSHGMILGENGEKMSKSRGNVINPDDIVGQYGADTFRCYEMFIGAFDQATPWSESSVKGCYKFIERVFNLKDMLAEGEEYSSEMTISMHKAIKKVGEDIERMKFNTAIATLMSLVNDFYRLGRVNKAEFKTFITLLNPFAPHVTEELWQIAGFEGMLNQTTWPCFDPALTIDQTIEIVVQINGKLKARLHLAPDTPKEQVEQSALAEVSHIIADKTVNRIIYVPNKLVNIVVK